MIILAFAMAAAGLSVLMHRLRGWDAKLTAEEESLIGKDLREVYW